VSDLRSSDRAPGLFVGAGVDIADDAAIGAHVVLHDGVVLARTRSCRTAPCSASTRWTPPGTPRTGR
jgi:hypothetical protein